MNPELTPGIFVQRWSEDPYLNVQINHFYRLREVERQLQTAEMRVETMERRAREAMDLVVAAEARLKNLEESAARAE